MIFGNVTYNSSFTSNRQLRKIILMYDGKCFSNGLVYTGSYKFYILFSSNRSGMWNIFAWDLERQKLFQLTSVKYGAIAPRLSTDGKTLAFLELHRGIHRVVTTPFKPEKETATAKGNTSVPAPDLSRLAPDTVLSPRPMNPGKVYTPFLHIPYVLSDEEETKAGLYILGGDPVGINSTLY